MAGAEVLAISVDSAETSSEALSRFNFDFPILADPALVAIDAFGVRHESGGIGGNDIARPAVFILDGDGRIIWQDLTDNWRVRIRPEQVLDQLE